MNSKRKNAGGIRGIVLAALCILLALLAACGTKTRIVHCDRCGKELKIREDSNMEDDTWIIYCSDCEKELGLDKIVPVD